MRLIKFHTRSVALVVLLFTIAALVVGLTTANAAPPRKWVSYVAEMASIMSSAVSPSVVPDQR